MRRGCTRLLSNFSGLGGSALALALMALALTVTALVALMCAVAVAFAAVDIVGVAVFEILHILLGGKNLLEGIQALGAAFVAALAAVFTTLIALALLAVLLAFGALSLLAVMLSFGALSLLAVLLLALSAVLAALGLEGCNGGLLLLGEFDALEGVCTGTFGAADAFALCGVCTVLALALVAGGLLGAHGEGGEADGGGKKHFLHIVSFFDVYVSLLVLLHMYDARRRRRFKITPVV